MSFDYVENLMDRIFDDFSEVSRLHGEFKKRLPKTKHSEKNVKDYTQQLLSNN
ncbi:MAG: hypothetical protein KKD48_05320 [Nanoarchaeota archaeon]|nr:hypothetical protein [Nanoarchaeota archaeon]